MEHNFHRSELHCNYLFSSLSEFQELRADIKAAGADCLSFGGQVKNVLIDAELKKYKITYKYPCYYPYKDMGDNGIEHISDNATFIEDLDF